MSFWVYMLRCADGAFYVGHTDDLESRVEALTVERQFKGWRRAKKEALIAGDWATISKLGRRGK